MGPIKIILAIAKNTFTKKHTNTMTSETKYTNIRDYYLVKSPNKIWAGVNSPEEEEKVF